MTTTSSNVQAAPVADEPLRVLAWYPEGGAFVPGRERTMRVEVVNPGQGLVPLQIRFRAPEGWTIVRSGTDVEHALGPGESQAEDIALTPPPDAPPRAGAVGAAPLADEGVLRIELRSGALRWTVAAGLPVAAPRTVAGAGAERSRTDEPGRQQADFSPSRAAPRRRDRKTDNDKMHKSSTPTTKPAAARRASKAGFSLTELMFVIGVITVLAAMTFPAVGFVRERARRNSCLNNMRQWGMALTGYLDDHRGVFPSPVDDSRAWYNVLPQYVGERPMKELVDEGRAPVPGGGRRSLFLCPSDRVTDFLEDETTEVSSGPYSSYAMNESIDSGENTPPYTKRLRLPQLKHPSTFVVLAESGQGCAKGIKRSDLGNADGSGDAFRHSRAINLCFADGSAASFHQTDVWEEGVADNQKFGTLIWTSAIDAEN